jgi:hypothetical protein
VQQASLVPFQSRLLPSEVPACHVGFGDRDALRKGEPAQPTGAVVPRTPPASRQRRRTKGAGSRPTSGQRRARRRCRRVRSVRTSHRRNRQRGSQEYGLVLRRSRLVAGMTIEEVVVVVGKRPGAVKALQRRGLAAVRRNSRTSRWSGTSQSHSHRTHSVVRVSDYEVVRRWRLPRLPGQALLDWELPDPAAGTWVWPIVDETARRSIDLPPRPRRQHAPSFPSA